MQSFIRKNIRHIVLNGLSLFSKPQPGVHILNGHYISVSNDTSNAVFRELLLKLIQHNVRLINIQEACEKINNKIISEDTCEVAFTFDDGFEECFTKIVPVLDEFKIKAAFFINPGFIDGDEFYRQNFLQHVVCTNAIKNPMTWEQVKSLHKNEHVIGSHTFDHCRLNGALNATYQIETSSKVIQEKLGSPCDYFAFTFGRLDDFDDNALQIAQKYHKYIFSQSDYQHYFSFNGAVINRRHFEPIWPYRHILYFLKAKSY